MTPCQSQYYRELIFWYSYVLFSIGNNEPLFEYAFPDCWDDNTTCSETWVQAVVYLETVGIICGQIAVGILGDWLGRRWGLIQDATIMFLGLVMLTASWGTSLSTPRLYLRSTVTS